jgi:hypothetical protein
MQSESPSGELQAVRLNKMNKFLLISLLFLINLIFGVLYLRLSPVCYQYLENSFNNSINFLTLIVSIPLYWILGIFAILLFARIPLVFPKTLVFGWVLCASILAFSLAISWKKLSFLSRNILLLLISIFLNFASLESLFISMGV